MTGGDGEEYRIGAAPTSLRPAPWTEQGFPFYSGRGAYRAQVELPAEAAGERLFLEIPMRDDVVEVEVNGEPAGVLLWDPYVLEVSGLPRPGRNDVLLRVANTPANLLNGRARPSGLAGTPRLHVGAPPELQSAGQAGR